VRYAHPCPLQSYLNVPSGVHAVCGDIARKKRAWRNAGASCFIEKWGQQSLSRAAHTLGQRLLRARRATRFGYAVRAKQTHPKHTPASRTSQRSRITDGLAALMHQHTAALSDVIAQSRYVPLLLINCHHLLQMAEIPEIAQVQTEAQKECRISYSEKTHEEKVCCRP